FLTIKGKYLNVDSKQLVGDATEYFVGKCWRGKIFFQSNNKRVSKGRNRIKESLLVPNSPIVPQAKFDTMLLDSHPLAKGATSNLVVLSYTDPQTRPYWAELVATKIQGLRCPGGGKRQIWTYLYWTDLVWKVRQTGGVHRV